VKRASPWLLSLVLLPLTALAQAPTISISGANFRPLPLALTAPHLEAVPASAASAFDEALLFDLRASGLFQMLERASFLADAREGQTAGSIDFARWTDVGAEVLVKTQLSASPGAPVRGDLRLFSVGSGREEFRLTGSAPASEVRALAHRFADLLYQHFTREPGPFQSRIAFVRRSGESRDVWQADWDGRNARALTQGGIHVLPAVVPNGQVAFTSFRRGRPELVVQRGGSAVPLVQVEQLATGVAYSADGSRVAYSLAQGEGAQIWVASADGTGARRITNTDYGINTSPTWSPDGKRLAFVSNRGGTPQVYVMNADGSGVQRLTFQGNYNQTPDWSPRGDLIAFTARDERNAFDLFTVNVDTRKVTRLTQDQGNNEEPSFSPNGRLILFSSTRNGSPHLFVMTADGSNQLPLPLERGNYLTPDWGR
jgi:TolB protein